MELNHPTPEDSHALLAARAETRAKEAEAGLSQSLEDNQSLLVALSAEQSKNEQLAKVIEEQAERLNRLKRDNQWYAQRHTKQALLLASICHQTREFSSFTDPGLIGQTPSDIICDYERGIAALGKVFHDHFGKVVPF